MRPEPRKFIAIAAASGRIGYAFFIDRVVCDWGLSRAASANPLSAAAQAQAWFVRLRPEVVVTERIDHLCRKGIRTRKVIQAIANSAAAAGLYDISVPRHRRYANKYDEASVLAERFPELAQWRPPRRRTWEPEPRNMTYFEALALAAAAFDGDGLAEGPPRQRSSRDLDSEGQG